MSYKIQSKSDFLTGVTLIVEIPESELDQKALYTIQEDQPDFILPFHYRNIDGQVEFVYQVGTHSKLQYLSGERLTKDYTEMWLGVLNPLLDCGDWFMNPYSFLLNAEYIYYEKNKKTVSYVYIPSTRICSDYDALKEMAAEVTRFISATDTRLENKVLRAIMKDFSPNEFLRMLKSYSIIKLPAANGADSNMPVANGIAANGAVEDMPASYAPDADVSATQPWDAPIEERDIYTAAPASKPYTASAHELWDGSERIYNKETPSAAQPVTYLGYSSAPKSAIDELCVSQSQETVYGTPGEIIISMPTKRESKKKKQENEKNNANNGEIKEKWYKRKKRAGGLFGWALDKQQETPPAPEIFTVPQPEYEPIQNVTQLCTQLADSSNDSQNALVEAGGASGARLRFIGNISLPQIIDIRIEVGGIFTVGRFDTAIGRQQSSFEFDKNTKAVSRRHAAIERQQEGYSIIDLSSSAGTFLNGQKLPPNTPCELEPGSHVSFGNAGVDYVWEDT